VSDIKEKWQKKWRNLLGETTDSMPHYSEDFALHFDIWSIEKEKLAECFSIFPHGQKVLKRVNEARTNLPKLSEINDQSLLNILDQMNRNIEAVLLQYGDEDTIKLDGEKKAIEKRCVYRGNEILMRELFQQADSPLIHLDDELCEIIKKYCGDVAYDAYFFLSEPLYQLGCCDERVAHWILWAMVEDEFEVDPYLQSYELYKMGAQAGWSNEELFVYIDV